MAAWKDSVSRFAQNAVSKSKEMAEVTRLNMEIGGLEQRIKENHAALGRYLLERPELLPVGDPKVDEILGQIKEVEAQIERDRVAIRELKNIELCPQCGAEVVRGNRFCPQCGSPMAAAQQSSQAEPAPAHTCPECGQLLDEGAIFCGNCGASVKSGQ